MARANRQACERLVEALGGRKLSTRQMGDLYAAYQGGNEETRERLLTDPFLFLRAQEEARRKDPPAPTPEQALIEDFERVGAACRRAHARLRKGVVAHLLDEQRGDVGRCINQARQDAEHLWRRCQEELTGAEPIDPHCDRSSA